MKSVNKYDTINASSSATVSCPSLFDRAVTLQLASVCNKICTKLSINVYMKLSIYIVENIFQLPVKYPALLRSPAAGGWEEWAVKLSHAAAACYLIIIV